VAIFFCPNCWAQIAAGDSVCPACDADLDALDRQDFDAKLIRALQHPEALTARRAAWILGQRRTQDAVASLLSRYRTGVDSFLGAEIAAALGRIGNPAARAALGEMAADRSFMVRRAAQAALDVLQQTEE
jgi:HEAT repeat protein